MKDITYFLKQIHNYSGKILYFNLIGMILMSLLEGAAILLLLPMISMSGIVELDTGGTPISGIFQSTQDIPVGLGLPLILGIYVLLVIIQNLLQRQIAIRNTVIKQGFLRHLRIETYSGVLHSNWNFFLKNRQSDLINILRKELSRASSGTNTILQFMSALIFTVVQIGLAFWLSPNITMFVLLCGLTLIFLNRKFLKRSLELGSRNFQLGKEYLAGVTDQVDGIKDIKSNTLEESRMNWFRSTTKSMQHEQVEYTKMKTKSQLYYKVASAILIVIFIYIAVNMFNAQGGQLILITAIFSRLWPRVTDIQASMEKIATTIPSFRAVKALQHECKESVEFKMDKNQRIRPLIVKDRIECRNVHFRYNQTESHYALKDINLLIPSNQMTAFVGRSGAGKSTLIDLLMGLNQPEKGQVLIDGSPLSEDNLLPWRRSISYIPQDPFLFNNSIRDNLHLVEPGASEKQMWEALEFSSAAEFVSKLPDGLDTLIGDRGVRLSGGERQRLVLARAILRKPSILVLDEATSALDTENEAKIQEALDRLRGKITTIVIAHRLSTIQNANQVIVLEEGEIVQNGGFIQLADEKMNTFNHLLGDQMKITQ